MVAVRAKLLPRARLLKSSKKLYDQLDVYQQNAVEFSIQAMTAALFFEQGTGKTWITGGVIERLFGPSYIGLLVVPLANLESTWVKFFVEQLPQVPVYRTWEAFKVAPAPKQLLLHYEAASNKKLITKLRRVRYTFIGYDESQRLKNRASIQSRHAAHLRASAMYKLILSGTPIEENPSDLWAQFRFLNPDVFGTVWKEFVAEYLEPLDAELLERFDTARPGSFRWEKVMREMRIANNKRSFDFGKLPQFLELIKPYSLRVTKDVLNLPPCNMHKVPIKLRGEQRRIYDELARDMVVRIGPNATRVVTPLRVTQLGRLQQIAGGYISDEHGDVHEVGRAKLRALRRIVVRQTGPVVIFCRFLEEIWAIEENLIEWAYDNGRPPDIRTLTGRNKKNRGALIAEFQAGDVDVLICQIKTGGVGIDLYRSSVAIFFSYTYSYIDFEQAVARLHRRGQTSKVDLFLLHALGTIDEAIYSSILAKRKITSKVLIELEHRRRSHGHEEHDEDQSGPRRQEGNRSRIQVRRQRPGGRTRHRTGVGTRRAA